MISAIIPSYKNPLYMQICIESALRGRKSKDSEIIVILDGFVEMSRDVINEYNNRVTFIEIPDNRGMQTAINFGVYSANNEYILVVNDDNVFPDGWDSRLMDTIIDFDDKNVIITPNQIEPHEPGMFGFEVANYGTDPYHFELDKFIEEEPTYCKKTYTDDGELFPFVMRKWDFMVLGGLDTIYPSPFVCDWDFFMRLEMLNKRFIRDRNICFYHFGSRATKQRDDQEEKKSFKDGEITAYQVFEYKWGFRPYRDKDNSHVPHVADQAIRGIDFREKKNYE